MAKSQSCLTGLLAGFSLFSILLLTTIAFFSSIYGWPVYLEILSHFQLQYFILSAIALVVIALTRYKVTFLIGLACTVALSTQILFWYLPPRFLTANGDSNLRVLISNVNTQNEQFEEVLAFTRQEEPDLALFMEVDEGWQNRLDELKSDLPHSSGEASPYNFGILLYSRYPLETVEIKDFAEDSTPSVVATIPVNGQRISFVGTHPVPPVRSQYFHSRNKQLDQMGQYLQTAATPQIVVGDFNITMWSPYYKRFIRSTDLKNVRKGFGLLPSWPTKGTYPPLPNWAPLIFSIPIDHCLVSHEVAVANVRVGPNIGSDHRPVVVDLRI
ncbi:endonuclease/exonuclease/phosphatase family protein [Oscillatoria sp. CS-180]|uniref:endonuclease/exonuclease/phosphatase family protein n=1 Tax=Oscillatoria sp. CS-180 TaxID=3021720 RepID=UPI00232C2B4E|nr:endonuclease/exonuclease/phosphatase family protein [Oscillatoria sp. CS-180]MDB9525555.1 endonuclease/exonuclease/phosphatase family protein [Oscillatoria sp. CS-180]